MLPSLWKWKTRPCFYSGQKQIKIDKKCVRRLCHIWRLEWTSESFLINNFVDIAMNQLVPVNRRFFCGLLCCLSVVTCPRLNVSNGNLSMTSRDYLDLLYLDCYHGYRVIANQSLTSLTSECTASGNWSVADVDCERKWRRVYHLACLAFTIANLIHKCFLSRHIPTLIRAFAVYVRPLLEYASPVRNPHLVQDIKRIESVQKRFTKRLPGMANRTYRERLTITASNFGDWDMILFVLTKYFPIHRFLTIQQHLGFPDWWILTSTVSLPLIHLPIQEVILIDCIRHGVPKLPVRTSLHAE